MSVEVNLSNFSIEQICKSGQCFRMRELSDGAYEVVAFGKYLKVYQDSSKVIFECSDEDYTNIWFPYFDLDRDYGKIISSIDKQDAYLSEAAKRGEGIRILRQDLWEMIISFIISQRNNIKRIRKCINGLCQKFGEEIVLQDGTIYYDFPTPEKLVNADIDDINSLSVGYRDVYIKRAAEAVYYGELDLMKLTKMNYEDAKEELLKLHGVGEKVANCICLFALHHVDAFPKDTHINQVLDREYKNGFPFEKYRGYAGILQQYMFFSEL